MAKKPVKAAPDEDLDLTKIDFEKADKETIERAVAAAERLVAIKKAEGSLLDFCKFMTPSLNDEEDATLTDFKVAPHLELIAERLEAMERGEIQRLLISMPPGHGKSQLCTRLFPAWFIGRNPRRRCLLVGYSETFARAEFGLPLSRLLKWQAYQSVFPGVSLSGGSKAVDNLVLSTGGYIASVGKGGALTGRRGELIVVDDPFKGAEEAASETERNKLWEWFKKDLKSRQAAGKNRGIVVIATRWHEEDLIGKILESEEAGRWEYLRLPAIFEERDAQLATRMGKNVGDALWPEMYDRDFMDEMRGTDPRAFQCLYQQEPVPDDGVLFRAEHLKEYREKQLPKGLRIYGSVDYAASGDQTADNQCFLVSGVDDKGKLWLLDAVWGKHDLDKFVEKMLDACVKWKPLVVYGEKGPLPKVAMSYLRRRMSERRVHVNFSEFASTKDKVVRSQAILARCSTGMVMFPEHADWWPAARTELLKFPNGKHDDFVDCMSLFGQGLKRQLRGSGVAGSKPLEIEPDPQHNIINWIMFQTRAEERARKFAEAHKGF